MTIVSIQQTLIFMMFMLTMNVVRAEVYYDDHATGWHWYDDPSEVADNPKIPPTTTPASNDPVEKMKNYRMTLTRSLDNAILHPTTENIVNYITLQNRLSAQSTRFAEQWQKVLLLSPELNYSLSHPTNQLATHIYADEHRKKEDKAIAALAHQSGLFFFYRSTCPYCQRFAPIVKTFAIANGLTVIPITTDGISLPEFPHSYPDQGQSKIFQVKVEPSLFAVNPYTKKAYPIAYGLISESELRQRILDIANRFQGVL
jgi:conjugal transfer pilus assembly protein TraF